MKLNEFINTFIEPNTIIRLLYKTNDGGHETVLESSDWDEVAMEWETVRGEGRYKDFLNHEVDGITDILMDGHYSEAVNIVLKRNKSDVTKAVEALIKALKTDEDYRRSWSSNIAMAFKDEFWNSCPTHESLDLMDEDTLHEIANKASENFLNTLCK